MLIYIYIYIADTHRVCLRKFQRLCSAQRTLKETQLHTWWLLQRILKCLRYFVLLLWLTLSRSWYPQLSRSFGAYLSIPTIILCISRCSGVRSLNILFSIIKTWKAKLHFNWQLRKDMSSENISTQLLGAYPFSLNWVSGPPPKKGVLGKCQKMGLQCWRLTLW